MRLPGLTLRVFPSISARDEALLDLGSVAPFDPSTFEGLIDALRLEGGRSVRKRASPEMIRAATFSAICAVGQEPSFKGSHDSPARRMWEARAWETLEELKNAALTPQQLLEAGGDRLQLLGRIFAQYEEALSRAGWVDGPSALAEATLRLEEAGLPRSWKRYRAVELLGQWRMTPLLRRFVHALAKQCERAELQLRLEVPAAGIDRVDGAVDGLFSELEREAQALRFLELAKEDRIAQGRPLAEVAARIFSGAGALDGPPSSLPLSIESAADTAQEIRRIADGVSRLIDQGAPSDGIAVVYREAGSELRTLAAELGLRGIPVARIFKERTRAAALRALELLRLPDDGYPAMRTAALLSTKSERAAALIARAGIRDDLLGAAPKRGAYAERLDALAARSGEGPLADEVRSLAQAFSGLAASCRSIPQEGTPSSMLASWWRAIRGCGLFEQAIDSGDLLPLQSLVGRLSESVRSLPAGSRRLSRLLFQQWMAEEVSHLVEEAGPAASCRGVSLLDVESLVGRRFDHLFLGGMIEGRFPRWGRVEPQVMAGRIPSSPLLLDADRAALNQAIGAEVLPLRAGWGTDRIPFSLSRERLLFYLALTAAAGSVTLSFARRGPKGDQVISPFLDALCRVSGRPPICVPSGPVPLWDELWTEQALRERCAREWAVSVPEPSKRSRLEAIFGASQWFQLLKASAESEADRLRFVSSLDQPEGPFSGAVSAPALREALRERFPFSRESPASASSLYQFGNCAFQGFLSYALGLREEERVGEEMDARAEGIFWHAVLERLLPLLDTEGLLGKSGDKVPDPAIDAAIETAWKDVGPKLHLGHPALRSLGRTRGRAMVRRFLTAPGSGVPVEGGRPTRLELHFGDKKAPEGWREIRVPGQFPGESDLYFRGTIDRLDEGPLGAAVIDYKSRVLESGAALYEELLETEFQLPLYLYAARRAQAQASQTPPPQAVWLSLKDGKALVLNDLLGKDGGSVDLFLADDLSTRELIAESGGKNLPNALHRLAGSIRQGRLGARPHDCERCAYAAVCRVSEKAQQAQDTNHVE